MRLNSWVGRANRAVPAQLRLKGMERAAAIGTENLIRFGIPAYALHPFALAYWAWGSNSK